MSSFGHLLERRGQPWGSGSRNGCLHCPVPTNATGPGAGLLAGGDIEHSGTEWITWDGVGKADKGDGRGMYAPECKPWGGLGRRDEVQ